MRNRISMPILLSMLAALPMFLCSCLFDLEAPQYVSAGSYIQVTGRGRAYLNFTEQSCKLYLSHDKYVNPEDRLLFDYKLNATAGEAVERSQFVQIPANIHMGKYWLILETGTYTVYQPIQVTNNPAITPDLVPVNLVNVTSELSGTQPTLGSGNLGISYTVRNHGYTTAPNSVVTGHLAKDGIITSASPQVFSRSIGSINPQSSSSFTETINTPTNLRGPNYRLVVTVDRDRTVNEANESNNAVSIFMANFPNQEPPSDGSEARELAQPTASPLELTVSPNPAADYVDIRLTTGKPGKIHVSLTDIKGATVHTWDMETPEDEYAERFPTNGLARGIYLIHVTTDDGRSTSRKLVIGG